MTIALIALGVVAVLALVYAVVMRGSLGLVKKRLHDEPDLQKPIPDEKLHDDGLPTDIDY